MPQVRRIVTGHDGEGRSIIARDELARTVEMIPGWPYHELWHTKSVPAKIDRESALNEEQGIRLEPPHGGARIRVVEFPPETAALREIEPAQVQQIFAAMGAPNAFTYEKGGKHIGMHRTPSLDFGIVLDGEITLVLDEGETLCRAGDVIVQNGTSHAWSNRSGKPTRICFVLIDGEFTDGLPGAR